jgi:hypothetical protein
VLNRVQKAPLVHSLSQNPGSNPLTSDNITRVPTSPPCLRLAERIRAARVQSPLASHHNPARASVSPAGGSVAVSDWRKSSTVILGAPVTQLPVLILAPLSNFRIIGFGWITNDSDPIQYPALLNTEGQQWQI